MHEDYPRRYADYVLLERLGQGGMSEVDLARKAVDKDQTYVRFTVIKRIKTDKSTDQSFIRMFKDEARITSELHHENIGQVYDFGKEGMEYYMALEYVPGVDVRYLINVLRERGQRVPVRVALRVIHDVLAALEYAHEKRDTFGKPMEIVHRDVNPRNVMLSIRGDVKLIDFGVAKATDRLERTRTDHVKGKFSYMAPEQISGQDIDGRADLYAVGLTLHEFLAGVSPFYGLNQIQIMHRMMHGQVADLPSVPELPDTTALARVYQRAMARNPKDRYRNATQFRKGIEEVARMVGGLPTREQMAAFLASVDPDLIDNIQRKMEAYAALEITAEGELTGPAEESISALAPMVPEIKGTDSESMTAVTRTGLVVGGSVVAMSMLSALVSAVVVAGALVGVWYYTQTVAPQPVPSPVPSMPGPEEPKPVVPPPTPQPRPSPVEPTPKPDPVPPPKPDPRPDPKPQPRPDPKPEPKPDPVIIPVPAQPVPQPDPVQPDPVPQPKPVQPDPEPVAKGTLQVSSNPQGKMVYIDGKEAQPTPIRGLELPVGTYQVRVEGSAERTVVIKARQRILEQF